MVPSGSLPMPDSMAVLAGKVIVMSAPAFATGARLGGGGAALTVMVTTAVVAAPLLSVAVSSKT